MPHAVANERKYLRTRSKHSSHKSLTRSKTGNSILTEYEELHEILKASALGRSLATSLDARLSTSRSSITRVVSLGLGSFMQHSKDQTRRLKQLAIFTFIVDYINTANAAVGNPSLEVYAQDPTFTRYDAIFLNSLGVQVITTPSPSELGQAQYIIDANTLVYSPFLTIEAYEALFASSLVGTLIGDDFHALKRKFDKGTSDQRSVEALSRMYVEAMSRRAINGDGFWDVKIDKPFPMALYWRQDTLRRDSKL